jgi:Holliday junction resolvase RusA-like endonuclease
METIVFEIEPKPKPRMTRKSTWKHRDWWDYVEVLKWLAKKEKYELTDELNISFYIPIPKSYSKKLKRELVGKPHRKRPDIDNLVKGFLDALASEDGFVWNITAKKYWNDIGRIVVRKG